MFRVVGSIRVVGSRDVRVVTFLWGESDVDIFRLEGYVGVVGGLFFCC